MAVNNFDYQISWSDFTQVSARPPGVDEDAEIHIKFPQRYDYTTGRNGATITNLNVDIGMNSPECWVVSSQASNATLLKHEQGHYDITALGAREFHDSLVGMTARNPAELNSRIGRLRTSIQQKIDRANINYDTQTNHSQNTSVQQTWDKKIDEVKKNPRGTINDLP